MSELETMLAQLSEMQTDTAVVGAMIGFVAAYELLSAWAVTDAQRALLDVRAQRITDTFARHVERTRP